MCFLWSLNFKTLSSKKMLDDNLPLLNILNDKQAHSQAVDIKNILSHQLAPGPLSMFTDSGDMWIAKAMSNLKKQLQTEVPTRYILHKKSSVQLLMVPQFFV